MNDYRNPRPYAPTWRQGTGEGEILLINLRLRTLLLKQKGTYIKIKDQPINTLPGPDTNVIDLAIVST